MLPDRETTIMRQLRKRRAAVQHIQSTAEYRAYLWALSQGLVAPLRGPDPEELPLIPKRVWERGIQDRRFALKEIERDTQQLVFMRMLPTP